MRYILAFATFALLAACASKPPVSLEGVDLTLEPEQAVDSFDLVRGNRVAWGGVIVATDNLAEHTRIEVLAFPLNRSARPETGATAQGRFIVRREGYLETVDYAPGRVITVSGTLAEIEAGTIGEADYAYPVVRADELHLWKSKSNDSGPFYHFGIGIVIGN